MRSKKSRSVDSSFLSFVVYTAIGPRFRKQLDKLFNLLCGDNSAQWEYEKDGTHFFLLPLKRIFAKLGEKTLAELQAISYSFSVSCPLIHGTQFRISWQGTGAGEKSRRNFLRQRQERFADEHKIIDKEINVNQTIAAWKLLQTWEGQDKRKLVFVIPDMFGGKKKQIWITEKQARDIVGKNSYIISVWQERYLVLSEKINAMETALENADVTFLLENGIHSEIDYDNAMGDLCAAWKQAQTELIRLMENKPIKIVPAKPNTFYSFDYESIYYPQNDVRESPTTFIQIVDKSRYDVLGYTWDNSLWMNAGDGI